MIGWLKRTGAIALAAVGLLAAAVLAIGMAGNLIWIIVSGLAGLPLLIWAVAVTVLVPAGWWMLFVRRRP